LRRFNRKTRALGQLTSIHREDPLSGVANLFDASIVFAVGLMVALIQAFSLAQLLDPNSQFTIVRKDAAGNFEIIEKTSQQVTVRKMSDEKKAGEGTRLGVAYQLSDGSVVYVPEDTP
jgi:hypothetical protein